MEEQNSFPIDAVITWVDGGDPKHADKLNAYLATLGKVRPRAASPMRFHHSGEIDYCVISLLRFAPWIRTIYIVTDEQQPDIVNRLQGTKFAERVVVVDHKVIFSGYEQYLPSFNSMSIASLLWKIPGLADHFIFLNDDFALIRPVDPSDFYRGGKLVLRGRWKFQARKDPFSLIFLICFGWLKKVFSDNVNMSKDQRVSFVGVQETSARLVGFQRKVFQLEHNPHSWLKQIWQSLVVERPAIFEKNISYQLRSAEQFVPEGYSAHYALKVGRAVVDNKLKTLQLKPAQQAKLRIKYKLWLADRNPEVRFVCAQSIELATEPVQKLLFSWLNHRIGTLKELTKTEQ